jgi:hypothetical protein
LLFWGEPGSLIAGGADGSERRSAARAKNLALQDIENRGAHTTYQKSQLYQPDSGGEVMAAIRVEELPYVEATLNYLAPTHEKPASYAYEPPPGAPWSTAEAEPHAVAIHDLRPAATEFALDDAGFAYVRHKSAVEDFSDDDEIRRVYYPESVELLKQITGAAEVRVFDHTLRRRAAKVENDRLAGVPRQPATRVHVDQTESSGVSRLKLLYSDEAEELLARRVAIVNLWRPIRVPAIDFPLAVCDARTVARPDLVASDLLFRDRRGETYHVVYNPAHRWFYAPEMRPDEVLLLKCFDSRDDGRVARFAPHTAFANPAAPTDARPRQSIELRTYVIYDKPRTTRH